MSKGSVPERPSGQRFSHVYLRSLDLLQDSQRARRRVAALVESIKDLQGMSSDLPKELGVDPAYGFERVNWPETLKRFTTADSLDFLTLTVRFPEDKKRSSVGLLQPSAVRRFILEAGRILREENLRYEMDSCGGVHFRVDAQFAANTSAAIAALGNARYANAREQFEAGMTALSSADIDGKQAIEAFSMPPSVSSS